MKVTFVCMACGKAVARDDGQAPSSKVAQQPVSPPDAWIALSVWIQDVDVGTIRQTMLLACGRVCASVIQRGEAPDAAAEINLMGTTLKPSKKSAIIITG